MPVLFIYLFRQWFFLNYHDGLAQDPGSSGTWSSTKMEFTCPEIVHLARPNRSDRPQNILHLCGLTIIDRSFPGPTGSMYSTNVARQGHLGNSLPCFVIFISSSFPRMPRSGVRRKTGGQQTNFSKGRLN